MTSIANAKQQFSERESVVQIEVVNQYGNGDVELDYVVRPLCAIGETFAAIAGTNTGNKATLSRHTLWRIQDLGYTIIRYNIRTGPHAGLGQVVENVADLFKDDD